MTKVLLTGRDGQLGQELVTTAPAGIELIITGRADLDRKTGKKNKLKLK